MFTNTVPYTDFHELNLDWILNQVSDLESRVTYIEEEFAKIEVLTKETIQSMIDTTAAETLATAEAYTDTVSETITAAYKKYVAAQIAIQKVYIDDQDASVLAQSKAYTDTTSIEDREYTDSKLINATFMTNPITGKFEDTRDVIESIVSAFHRTDAISAGNYDAKQITAGDYDALNLTAFNYDYHAATLLP